MELYTEIERAKTPALYTHESTPAEKVPIAFKLFDPYGSFTWYITEADFDEELAFGFTTSHLCPQGELGYTSLAELREAKFCGQPRIERDLHFGQHTLADVMAGKVR